MKLERQTIPDAESYEQPTSTGSSQRWGSQLSTRHPGCRPTPTASYNSDLNTRTGGSGGIPSIPAVGSAHSVRSTAATGSYAAATPRTGTPTAPKSQPEAPSHSQSPSPAHAKSQTHGAGSVWCESIGRLRASHRCRAGSQLKPNLLELLLAVEGARRALVGVDTLSSCAVELQNEIRRIHVLCTSECPGGQHCVSGHLAQLLSLVSCLAVLFPRCGPEMQKKSSDFYTHSVGAAALVVEMAAVQLKALNSRPRLVTETGDAVALPCRLLELALVITEGLTGKAASLCKSGDLGRVRIALLLQR